MDKEQAIKLAQEYKKVLFEKMPVAAKMLVRIPISDKILKFASGQTGRVPEKFVRMFFLWKVTV